MGEKQNPMMNEKILRVGFVGAGDHATQCIYPSLRMAPCKLAAITDLDQAKAEDAARRFGAGAVYTDYHKMMEKETLDAIFCVGGEKLHMEVAMAAMDAGLHVFIEKPPCENSGQAEQMLKKSKAAGKHIMVGFMKRFATGFQLAKEVSLREEFGGIHQYLAKFTTGRYKKEERFIPHHTIHHFDLARFFLGEITELYTRSVKIAEGKVGYDISLKSANGAIGTIQMSSLHDWSYPNERVEVTGDERVVIVDNITDVSYYRPRQRRNFLEQYKLEDSGDALHWSPNMTASVLMSHRGYEGEVAHFVNSILTGTVPMPDIGDGVKTMRLLDAFNQSVKSSSPVTVKGDE